MANQKFTLEEILNEYNSDGKRSGIRRSEDAPLAKGTLETEKLLSAVTSNRPLSRERGGYRTIPQEEQTAPLPQEELVDIKSTISHIKASKEAQEAREAGTSPVLRERFPTQHLSRNKVSFLQSAGAKGRGVDYMESHEETYDAAVKLQQLEELPPELPEEGHRPKIRQMQDSTRAKEKGRKKRRRSADVGYPKESVTGVLDRPNPTNEKIPTPRRHWEDEQDFYYQKKESDSVHSARQRVRSHTKQEDVPNRKPDDVEAARKLLCNLRNVVFFRCAALLFLTLIGAVLAFGENLIPLAPRVSAGVELGLILLSVGIAFPTVKNGFWNFIRFHADSDSMAVLPVLPATISTILALIQPQLLAEETFHLYVPCSLLALFCNAIGRLLVVRRALRNCNVVSREGQKRVLSYVSQEESAELLTRGTISDYPIVTAVRKADALCDFLRYTYSTDMADALCRRMTPICAGLSLAVAVCMTLIRMGTAFSMLWFGFFFTLLTLLMTASCCVASALVANLPLERESKKAATSDSAMLGYQSVDDFFDTNALLVEANDLFPSGSVQIQGMKVFSSAKMDDVLLDTASLVKHADSMLQGAFSEMISDGEGLRSVEEFVCEDGLGLCGWIANRRVLFGGREMMASHNIEGLPTKTREAELAEGNGDVLYLSVSGVLSAMFSIRVTADPMVRRQMQALKQERIALIVRSVDSSVTLRRVSALFNFPEHLMKIIPVSMHHLFQRETADLGCVSASMTVGGTGFGAASLLLGARRVRRAAVMGVILQVVSALLGLSLAMIHIVIGAYGEMTAQFFFLYHLIMTVITAIAVRIR